MAHGAGRHDPRLAAMAHELAVRNIANSRYRSLYGERIEATGFALVAHATVRVAVAAASRLVPELPLVAGGRSFGGRMTSAAQAESPLPDVRGLAFLGFPLHPAGKPSDERGAHLTAVRIPMLFLQGTRDELADLQLLQALAGRLGARATLAVRGCGPFVSRSRAHGTQRLGRPGRNGGRVGELDRNDDRAACYWIVTQ
jgi:predicted alpha/beta-hydrolase family hydrolase